jgi:hypothetical protein
MTSTYERKFIKVSHDDPRGFDAACRRLYGHDPKTVTALLDVAAKLYQPAGGKLTDHDIKLLKTAHPNAGQGVIDAIAKGINDAAPRLRGAYFVGAITGDVNVLEDRMSDASSAYKQVDDLVTEYSVQEYAEAINQKRGGTADAPPAWKPEPGSVRDLIERQVTPRGVREFSEAVERGEPRAEAIARHTLATDIERAGGKLQDDSLSLREHLTAAADLQEYESIAADQFGATSGEGH